MKKIPTREEFGDALINISSGYASLVTAEDAFERMESREKYLKGRRVALIAYDAQADRIAELEEIIAEMPVYTHEVATMNEARARIAELEAQLSGMAFDCDSASYELKRANDRIAELEARLSVWPTVRATAVTEDGIIAEEIE